jgi:hypothetical protein
VRDDDELEGVKRSDDLPAFFTIDDTILFAQSQRVQENARGVLERHAMLSQIARCLVLIPLKSHAAPPQACNDKNVTTIPQLFKPAA